MTYDVCNRWTHTTSCDNSFRQMLSKFENNQNFSFVGFDTEKIEAKAKCTIDYFVFKRVKNDRWSKKCISIEKI